MDDNSTAKSSLPLSEPSAVYVTLINLTLIMSMKSFVFLMLIRLNGMNEKLIGGAGGSTVKKITTK